MIECLYKCGSGALSTQEYHVYPLSASNLDLQLPKGVVCDKCNAFFSQLENYFTNRHPGAGERLLALRETRKGKEPKFESQTGTATRRKTAEGFEFTYPLEAVQHEERENGDIVFRGTFTPRPYDSVRIGRVLAKITLESLWPFSGSGDLDPYGTRMDPLRHYARLGPSKVKFLWFAWKRTQQTERRPQVITIQDPGDEPISQLCRMFLPGVAFLLPIPPVTSPSVLRQNLRGWNVVGEAGDVLLPPSCPNSGWHVSRAKTRAKNSSRLSFLALGIHVRWGKGAWTGNPLPRWPRTLFYLAFFASWRENYSAAVGERSWRR